MKRTLLSFFLIHFSFCIFSQITEVKGTVKDSKTKEPLIAATIKIGNNKGVVTDLDGKYEFPLKAGKYELSCSFVGYESKIQQVELKEGEQVVADFLLDELPGLMQTTTVTSGKFEKPLSEVTVSLDVLKPSFIQNINATSVERALDRVPGVNMIDGQANIRGGSGYSYGAGSRVMLLVDDIPALQADAGFPNWSDIPVENIEQIEVVKGAASALYGSAAMNGIINVRTGFAKSEPETNISFFGTDFLDPRDKSLKWWTTPRYEAGGSILHKQKFGKLDCTIGAFYLNNDSYNKDTYSKYGRGTINLRYRISERLSIGINGILNTGASSSFFFWSGNQAAGKGTFTGNPTTFSVSKKTRYNIDPYIQYFDKNGSRHKIITRFNSIDNDVSGDRSNKSKLYYGEYQFQHNFQNAGLVVTAGVLGTYNLVSAKLYGDTTYKGTNFAGYLQLDQKVFNRLNFSLGFRWENNKLMGPHFIGQDTVKNPNSDESRPVLRLGANYQIGKATYLRASWGQGYRFPTIAEKFIFTTVGFVIFPNPELKSEHGWSSEVGIKQGFKFQNFNGYFDVSGFWSQYYSMMEFAFSFYHNQVGFQSQNIGDTDIKGVEIELMGQGKIGKVLNTLITGYTFIDPKYQDFSKVDTVFYTSSKENILKYRFRHNFKLDWEASISDFSLGLTDTYVSYMEAIDKSFNTIIPGLKQYREKHPGGTNLVDVRASYSFSKHLKLSLIARNLFNIEYTYRPALFEAPRNISLRMDAKF